MAFAIFLLEAVALLDLLAVSMIIPLISNHAKQLGANHIYIGLLGSIYAGFQLVSGPLVGSLSDIKGRKFVLFITLIFCSLSYIIIGVTTSVLVILVIRAFLGLLKQTQMLTKALVPDYEKNEPKQSDIYGKLAAISGVGMTLGPIIGGHIAEDHPENGFMYIGMLVGLLFLVNAGIVQLLPNAKRSMKEPKTKKAIKNTKLLESITSSIKQSVYGLYEVNWSKYWEIFVLKAFIAFAMSVYYSNYSLYLKSQFSLTPKYIGYVISFQAVIGSVTSFFIGYINKFYKNDEDYSLRNLHVFILLSISLIGIIISNNVFIYVLWLVPLAGGNAIGRLVTLEMILKKGKNEHRGKLIGASSSVRSLNGIIAPMVAGFIGQYFGVFYVSYASALMAVLGTLVSYHVHVSTRLKKKTK